MPLHTHCEAGMIGHRDSFDLTIRRVRFGVQRGRELVNALSVHRVHRDRFCAKNGGETTVLLDGNRMRIGIALRAGGIRLTFGTAMIIATG